MWHNIRIINPKTGHPDGALALSVVEKSVQRGLLLYKPGDMGMVKITPPFVIAEDALKEGIGVLDEVLTELESA